MKKETSIQSPLARARGLGSTGHGFDHWMAQRVTAVANLGLMIWLVCSVVCMGTVDYTTFTAWLAQPVNAVLMILAVISVFYHATLGLQVVYEDYLSCRALRTIKIYGARLFFIAAGVACVFSVLKIAFTG